MAGGAHSIRVPVVHREEGVIPIRRNPRSSVVASRAGGRKSCRNVIGTRRTCVIHFVTGVTGRRNSRVIVIHVATCARHLDVEARQRKSRGIVIEAGRNPGCGVVTYLALLGESRLRMIRTGRPLEVFQMAGNARCAGQAVIIVYVTLSARHMGMRPGERKS